MSHRPAQLLPPEQRIGLLEFIVLMAALMALSALAIDSMLPALPTISSALGFAEANRRQWVITAYVAGMGVGQIYCGTLADSYGRKPLLIVGLLTYVVFSIAAAMAVSFETLILARLLEGIGAACTRVIPISIVRDLHSGRQMARVMSLTSIVFMAVPILAPSFGQAMILLTGWRWEFGVLAVFGVLVLFWTIIRLPETIHPEDKRPIGVSVVRTAIHAVVFDRLSMGYTFAGTAVFGALMGFINSVQQVFADFFHAARSLPFAFAFVALFIALSSFANARLVTTLGMRRISHTALLGFIVTSAVHTIVAVTGYETLLSFVLLQAATMFCFGMVGGNFNAMAMERLGHFAGTASSVQGFIMLVGGSLIGVCIGQSFNGTTVPLATGFMVAGMAALGGILFAERGRLLRPQEEPPAPFPARPHATAASPCR